MALALLLQRLALPAGRARRRELSSLQRFHESRLFPYRREQVFDVVADVDRYCEFVPLCTGSTVFHATRRAGPPGQESVQAELVVGYPPFHGRYTSDVVLERPQRIVATSGADGRMFQHMRTLWEFEDAAPGAAASPVSPFVRGPGARSGPATRVRFSIEYEFISALHAHAASLALDRMARSTVAAYLDRCRALYGP
ncbi:Coenzyme Q-binding protein coq10a, mitochondrial [Coemansia spiralis]|nr:Coenzyme Q-binding protein coq10a, mitochondrial [Coemansia spiralis]